MAEKIKGDIDCDENDIPCVVLHKNREKISEREAFEWLESHGYEGNAMIHLVPITDRRGEIPAYLYNEGRGETWYLYAPEDILPMIERWAREAEG